MAEPDASDDDKPRTAIARAIDALASLFDWLVSFPLAAFAEVGVMARLTFETVLWGIRPPYRPARLIDAMNFIGVESIFIVGLTGLLVGGVFSLQIVDSLRQFSAESRSGQIVGLALARELGPVFSALMISSRAGSSIATEIGSMRVSSQIDALTTMSVSPVQYLIAPRVLAGILVCPAMALLFDCIGLFGAYAVAVHVYGLDGGVFLELARWLVDGIDIAQGLVKAAIFGAAVTLIACRQGFYATGGAAGVGQATNRAVVQSAVAVLVLDYFVTTFFVG